MSLAHTTAKPTNASAKDQDVTVLLVHGGAMSSRMYRTMTPYLKTPSIAIDLPGHGKSVSLGPFTFETSTKHLYSFIQDLYSKSDSNKPPRIVLVGISLGGQAVLHYILNHPSTVSAAIVSGASIHPPDEKASWELPHMPSGKEWVDIMMEDVAIMGMDKAFALQQESLAFIFEPMAQDGGSDGSSEEYPPMLICVGEHDVAMAKRDYEDLLSKAKKANKMSEGKVLTGLWHNHSIDAPETFAAVVDEWVQKIVPSGGPASET